MGAPLSTVSLSPLPPAVSATRLPLSAGTSCASALEIAVRNTFNGEPLLLDSLRYQNGAGETLAVTRLSMLLSGFAIEREKGEWVEIANQDACRERRGRLINARTAATQKWVAWVAFNAPHTPFHVPPTALHSYGANPGTNLLKERAAG